MFKSVVKTTF